MSRIEAFERIVEAFNLAGMKVKVRSSKNDGIVISGTDSKGRTETITI